MADFNNAGAALKLGDGASPEVFTTIANVMNHGDLEVQRESNDTTKLSGTVRTAKAGIAAVQPLTIEGTYDPNNAQIDSLWSKVTTNNQTDTNWQLDLPTSPVETWAFSGFVQSFAIVGNTPGGLVMFRATLAINSVPTLS